MRVVTLSSAGIRNAPSEGIIFPALTTNMADYGTFARYGQSKAANILFASELARRYPSLTSVSLHPGVIDTQLSDPFKGGNGWKGFGFGLVVALVGKSLSEGTKNQLWCATAKDVVSGRFYPPFGAENAGRGFPDNKELAK